MRRGLFAGCASCGSRRDSRRLWPQLPARSCISTSRHVSAPSTSMAFCRTTSELASSLVLATANLLPSLVLFTPFVVFMLRGVRVCVYELVS